ncbi:MAG: uracil-DNA glycosylase [Alphaproteobacteria bacterium]
MCQKAETLEELKKWLKSLTAVPEMTAIRLFRVWFGDSTAAVSASSRRGRVGHTFVGRRAVAGKMLKAIGFVAMNFITNVLPWRPPDRTPTEGEIAVCLPFLKRQIDLVSPEAIMILGGSAANALLDNGEPISRMRGKWLEYKKSDGGKVPVLASFHPAYLLRNSGQKAKAWVDMLRMKQKLCNN